MLCPDTGTEVTFSRRDRRMPLRSDLGRQAGVGHVHDRPAPASLAICPADSTIGVHRVIRPVLVQGAKG